jgi:hypothetical protein
MEPSHSWEANSCSATPEISNILWNPKVCYSVHKSPPLVLILSQITSPSHPVFLRSNLKLSSYLRLCLPSSIIPSGISTKALMYAPVRATCPAHLTHLDLIVLTVFVEDKILQSFGVTNSLTFCRLLALTTCPSVRVWGRSDILTRRYLPYRMWRNRC